MKAVKVIQAKAGSVLVGMSAVLLSQAAAAQGLSKAKGVLETLQAEILTIIPVIAVIALIILGICYANKVIDKEDFGRWGVGVIVAGSAVEIVAMLFT